MVTAQADAQAKKYKIDGRKCPRVEITDPGEFYSTYDFEDGEVELMKIDNIKPVLLEKIEANHTETSWPSALAKLDNRTSNPDKVKSYVVYSVAKINDKYILVVPAKYNSDKEEGWAPSHDIFFVVGQSGIQVK